jgi:hypothetical protein
VSEFKPKYCWERKKNYMPRGSEVIDETEVTGY